MVRQVARQFCRLGEVHSLSYGRRASGENGRKMTASTRVGSGSRLMDYLGLSASHLQKGCASCKFILELVYRVPHNTRDSSYEDTIFYTLSSTASLLQCLLLHSLLALPLLRRT